MCTVTTQGKSILFPGSAQEKGGKGGRDSPAPSGWRMPLSLYRLSKFGGKMTCRACGLEHPPTMRCEVARRLSVSPPANTDKAVSKVANCPECEKKDAEIAMLRAKLHKPDRKTYMRDLMRRKRAEAKARAN